MLKDLRAELDEVKDLTKATSKTTNKILESLKLDWLQRIGQDVRAFMRKVFYTNIAIYKAVLDIRSLLPSHLERSLYQEPFIFEDGIGRLAPVHLQFITSWEAFDSVIELRFQGLQGYRMVQQRRYVMQDGATHREIDRSRPWEASFLPGQKVVMSMLFNDAESNTVSCPRCQTSSEGSLNSDIQWFVILTPGILVSNNFVVLAVPCGTGASPNITTLRLVTR